MRFPGQGLPIIGPLLFPKVATLPPIPEPAVAPDPDDEAIKTRQRRKSSRVRQRSGRLSTTDTAPLGTVLG